MIKHKSYGFTVVELIVVIVVIAVLVSITAIAYRSTQADSRDKKRIADAMILKSAIDEYYADNGAYPRLTTCEYNSGAECVSGQVWTLLQGQGYLERIPMPDLAATHHTSGINLAPDGKAYYLYYSPSTGAYNIYVPLESGDCKIAKNSTLPTLWSSVPECTF